MQTAITVAYGAGPDQVGDLYLPPASRAPLTCLFHGGFWRMPYGRDQLDPVAQDLCRAGFAVWNLEYRRTGAGGHPWPATFEDAEAILARLSGLAEVAPQLDLSRLALVGHSAGGHLAFWAGARAAGSVRVPRPAAVVGLAPVLDLEAAEAAGLGDHAAATLLGGSPAEVPARYASGSPRALLPLRLPQYLIHGEADTVVPAGLSRAYAEAARQAGDEVSCIVLPGVDHMGFLDPAGAAHRALRQCLLTLFGPDGPAPPSG